VVEVFEGSRQVEVFKLHKTYLLTNERSCEMVKDEVGEDGNGEV